MYPVPYLDFLRLANAGQYREALLRLEEAWFGDRSEFYAGLLQVMVACNQLDLGLRPERTIRRAIERLTPYAPEYQGLDVAALLRFLQQSLDALHGRTPRPPRLELKLVDREARGGTNVPGSWQ